MARKDEHPHPEADLVVDLNSDIFKTINSLQEELQSFREDSLNERKEHQDINEALLRNMTVVNPLGKSYSFHKHIQNRTLP